MPNGVPKRGAMCEESPTRDNTTGSKAEKIKLVKEDTFWPEGRFSFRCGDLVWSRTVGWQKYYKAERSETHFKTAEEAMKAWESSPPKSD
jgi:hypothetical protein